MSRAGSVVVAALLLAACSSAAETGPCAQRKGTYVTNLKVRTGDCGDVAEFVDTSDKQPTTVDPPCTGKIGYSADNCAVTNEIRCPVDSVEKGAVATSSGKYDWEQDGSYGSGILELSIVNSAGKNLCAGTYDVTVKRR